MFYIRIIVLLLACTNHIKTQEINNDVKINADNIDYYSEGKRAEAEGNVKLEHQLKGKKISLKSKKLNATFDDNGNLLEAEATGEVGINYDGTTLKAEKCTHSFSENKTICQSEHVHLIQGPNELHGQIATLDFNTQIFTMQTTAGMQIDSQIYTKKAKE